MNDVGIRITAKDDTSSAFAVVNRGLDSIKNNADLVKNALAGLGVGLSAGAFVAWTQNIINGIDALNDLKDATGASIENISALENIAKRTGSTLDTVGTSLIKLNQGLNSAKPGSDTALAIEAIGLSVKDLKALDPAEALQRIAVELSNFADDGNKARIVQELFGKSLKEVSPLLKDIADAGTLVATVTSEQAEAAEKLNKQLFNLQTNSQAAARSFVNDLIPTVGRLVAELTAGQKAAGGFVSALFLIGTSNPFNSIQENIKVYREQLSGLSGDLDRYKRAGSDTRAIDDAIITVKKRLEYFKDIQRQEALESAGTQSAAETRRLTGTGSAKQLVDIEAEKSRLKAIEDANKAAAKAAQEYARELDAQNKLLDTLSGYSSSYAEEVNRVARAHASGRISLEAMAEAQRKIFAQQPLAKQMAKDEEEVTKEFLKAYEDKQKAYEDQIKALNGNAESVEKHVQRLEDEEKAVAIVTLTNISLAEAMERVSLARSREAYEAAAAAGSEDQILIALQREIAARDRLVSATATKITREKNAQAAKDAAEEWKRAAERIESSITDALLRAFESGKSPAEAFASTFRNLFATMVLRPVVSAGVSAATSAVGSAAGSAAASFTGSAFASSIGIDGLKGGQLQLSESAMQNLSNFADAATTVGNALNYLDAAQSASGGRWGTAAGQALGTYYFGPLGGIVGKSVGDAIDKAFGGGGDGTPTRNLGDIRQTYDRLGLITNTETQVFISDQARQTAKAMSDSYFSAARALGVTAATSQFGFGSNNIDGGKVIISSSVGGKTYGSNEVDPSLLQLVASRAVLSALQGSDLPLYLSKVFNNLNVDTATQDAIKAAIDYAGSLKTVRESLMTVGEYTDVLQWNVYKGFTELQTTAKTFKEDFTAAIDAGLDPDQLKQWQKLGADMNSLSVATNDYSMTVRSQVDILKERQSLQEKLDSVMLTSVQLLEKQRNAIDASNQALFDQVQAQTTLKKVNEENASWNEKIAVLTGKSTQRQIDQQHALDSALDKTTKSLINEYYKQLNLADAAEAATKAQDDYNAALSSAKDRVVGAISSLNVAMATVDAVRAEGTNAYLSALGEVNVAQDKIAQLQLQSQVDIAKAANEAAKQMGELGQQLHDFIDGLTVKPTDTFAKTLTAALGGDKTAMQALSGAATGAIDAARTSSGSAADFAIAQGRILAQVNAVALLADAASRNTVMAPTGEDPLVVAQRELTVALMKQSDALSVANTIGAPLVASVTDLIAKYNDAQSTVFKTQQDLFLAQTALNAIQANTSNTVTAVNSASASASAATISVKAAILNELVNSVSSLDFNKDGLLTIDEFLRGMSGKATDAELKAIYTQADTNNDGVVSKLEAVAAYSKITSEKDLSVTNIIAGANAVTFSPDDPIRSVFNNISATNVAILESQRANVTELRIIESIMMATSIYGQLVKFDRGSYTGGVYANGGAFTNGIVTLPTSFNASLMGEAGPEAIMPLANINGSLGVRVAGGNDSKAADEIRALRDENRAQASALVQLMQRFTKLTERWDATGMPETRVTA